MLILFAASFRYRSSHIHQGCIPTGCQIANGQNVTVVSISAVLVKKGIPNRSLKGAFEITECRDYFCSVNLSIKASNCNRKITTFILCVSNGKP